jgi:hypothetical protein
VAGHADAALVRPLPARRGIEDLPRAVDDLSGHAPDLLLRDLPVHIPAAAPGHATSAPGRARGAGRDRPDGRRHPRDFAACHDPRGATDVLAKPFKLNEIMIGVRNLLQAHTRCTWTRRSVVPRRGRASKTRARG